MTEKMNVGPIFTAALVFIGDLLLTLRFSDNSASDICGVFLAIVVSFVLLHLFLTLKSKIKKTTTAKFVKDMVVAVFLLLSALYTLWNFCGFARSVMLKNSGGTFIFLSFSALAFSFAFLSRKLIIKLGLLFFAPSVLGMLLIFVFSLRFIEIKYLIPYKVFEAKSVLDTFIPLLTGLVPSVLTVALLWGNKGRKGINIAFFSGAVIILLCIICTLGIFGSSLAAKRSYPFADAVGAASMGQVFSRMDVFLYITCFCASLIKAGTAFFGFGVIVKRNASKFFALKQKNY